MAQTKTKPEAASVAGHLAAISDPVRRADGERLAALMTGIAGEPPRMWGPSMIGFGEHHYRYDSGREGTIFRIGFAPRKAEQVLYGLALDPDQLARLGKHRTGKSCLYIKRLADVDTGVLAAMIRDAWAASG